MEKKNTALVEDAMNMKRYTFKIFILLAGGKTQVYKHLKRKIIRWFLPKLKTKQTPILVGLKLIVV